MASSIVAPDLYKLAAQPLPGALTVQNTPLLSQGVDFKGLSDEHRKAYDTAMQFGRLNPDIVLNALKDGGALSNSFGFNSADSVSGMTPELFAQLFHGGGAMENLSKAKTVLDQVTNAPEQRAMMQHLADSQFSAGTQALSQQSAQNLQAQVANAGHAANLATQQAGLTQQADITNKTLEQNKLIHDETLANQIKTAQMHIASSEKIANQVNQRAVENMKAQLQMHKESLKLQLDSTTANHQATLAESAAKRIETAVLAKTPTEASAGLINETLQAHPELNTGLYYEYHNNVVFPGGKLVPMKLSALTLKDGTKVWAKVDSKGNPTEIFSARK